MGGVGGATDWIGWGGGWMGGWMDGWVGFRGPQDRRRVSDWVGSCLDGFGWMDGWMDAHHTTHSSSPSHKTAPIHPTGTFTFLEDSLSLSHTQKPPPSPHNQPPTLPLTQTTNPHNHPPPPGTSPSWRSATTPRPAPSSSAAPPRTCSTRSSGTCRTRSRWVGEVAEGGEGAFEWFVCVSLRLSLFLCVCVNTTPQTPTNPHPSHRIDQNK